MNGRDKTVPSVRERFCERGLRGIDRKSPDRVYEEKLDGGQEAELLRMWRSRSPCSEAPEGRSQWSLRLLADRLVELGVVDRISHEAVRQTLKKRTEAGSEALMGDSAGARRLDVAEIEQRVLASQCLCARIPILKAMRGVIRTLHVDSEIIVSWPRKAMVVI